VTFSCISRRSPEPGTGPAADDRAEQRRGVRRDYNRQQQGHPDGEQCRSKDDPATLPGRQCPGELGFLREVTFDLVELALFVLG